MKQLSLHVGLEALVCKPNIVIIQTIEVAQLAVTLSKKVVQSQAVLVTLPARSLPSAIQNTEKLVYSGHLWE